MRVDGCTLTKKEEAEVEFVLQKKFAASHSQTGACELWALPKVKDCVN